MKEEINAIGWRQKAGSSRCRKAGKETFKKKGNKMTGQLGK